PTAHDMVREHRVLTALEPTPVPVPRILHLGEADGPLGAPFYVMERVVGHICRNALPPGYAETPERRQAIGEALVDVLADLDPLTDLGALLAFWSEEADPEVLLAARIVAPVTAAGGFPGRGEVIERYARVTGFDVSDVDWYQAFAFFKLAVVCQGIAARAAGGAMVGSGFDDAQRLVAPLVDAGRHLLGARRAGGPRN